MEGDKSLMLIAKPSAMKLDELLRLGSDARVEIIEGEIVEMSSVGIEHAVIADNVYRALFQFVTKNNLGYVFSADLIYVLKEDKAKKLRNTCAPDTSFVRRGRFPKDFNVKKPFPGGPDLAVEVMSPDDKAEAYQPAPVSPRRAKSRPYLSGQRCA